MRAFVLAVLVLGMVSVFPPEVFATKNFATKHGLTCNVCHTGPGSGPLTLTGQNFLRNGLRFADDKATTDVSNLFSINLKLRAHDSNAPGRNATFEGHAVEFFSGGVLSDHFSYFMELYLYENVGRTTASVNSDFGRGKLSDAFLMFNSNPNKAIYTTVRFGQITPELPNNGARFTETRPYVVNNSAVSPNTFRPFMRNFGISVAQHVKAFHAEVSVVNGTGSSPTNSIDTNEQKDIYAVVDYDIGGGGSNVGVFGYRGRGRIVPSAGPTWDNKFHRYGAFGQLTFGKVNVTSMVTSGEEQLTAQGKLASNLGFLGEAAFVFSDKLVLFGRYDYFDQDTDVANDELSGPVVGFSYGIVPSGRFVFEYHKQGRYVATGSKPWECRAEIAFMF